MNFTSFTSDILTNNWNVFGAEVYCGGRLAHSFGDTQGRHPVYSATKTITAIAVGMAVDDGRLDISRPVLDYLPGEFTGAMTSSQREAYRAVTLRRLITMSVNGFPFRPDGDSWIASALSYPVEPDNTEFNYSNVAAYLAGVAASCAVGEDLYDYLDRRLFAPLDISAPPYARCPDGFFYGASSMELSVNELSRIGLMLYNGGMYNGARLLSEAYVQEMTSLQQHNREGGYGYFVWKYRSGFSINGKWGQKCYVLPSDGMMVTYLARIEEGSACVRESMERNILSTF